MEKITSKGKSHNTRSRSKAPVPVPLPIKIETLSQSSDDDVSLHIQEKFPKFINNGCLMCPVLSQNTSDLISHVEGVHHIIAGKDFEIATVSHCKHCPKKCGKKENGMALFLAHVFSCKQSKKGNRKKQTPKIPLKSPKKPQRNRESLFEISTSQSDTSIVDSPRTSKRLQSKRLRSLFQSQKPNMSPFAYPGNGTMEKPNFEFASIMNHPPPPGINIGSEDRPSTSNGTAVPMEIVTPITSKSIDRKSQSSSQRSEPKTMLRGSRKKRNPTIAKPKVLFTAPDVLIPPISNTETTSVNEKEISQNSSSNPPKAPVNKLSTINLDPQPIPRRNDKDSSLAKIRINADSSFIKQTESPCNEVGKKKLDNHNFALNMTTGNLNEPTDKLLISKPQEIGPTPIPQNQDSNFAKMPDVTQECLTESSNSKMENPSLTNPHTPASINKLVETIATESSSLELPKYRTKRKLSSVLEDEYNNSSDLFSSSLSTDGSTNSNSECPIIIVNSFSVPHVSPPPINNNNDMEVNSHTITEPKSKQNNSNAYPMTIIGALLNNSPNFPWISPFDDDSRNIQTANNTQERPNPNLNKTYSISSKDTEKALRKKVGLTRWNKIPNQNSRWECSKCRISFGFQRAYMSHVCGRLPRNTQPPLVDPETGTPKSKRMKLTYNATRPKWK